MSVVTVTNLNYRVPEKTLYKDASFDIFQGEHVGVVGQNGAGKSTLIKILLGELLPDSGEIKWQKSADVAHLDQYAEIDPNLTIQAYLEQAYTTYFEMEARMNEYYMAGDEASLLKAAGMQERLIQSDFYAADRLIEQATRGLGIDAPGMDRKISDVSGGQRAKIILAKLLLEKPQILLLDEPTNFLDKEHVEWLSEQLIQFPGTFIVVSHDIGFLEKIAKQILDVEFGTIRKYNGSYSHFVKQKEHLNEEYRRQYVKQQRMIEETESYIRKNKAGVNSKMARGREKQLNRLERLDAPESAVRPSFAFPEASQKIIGKSLVVDNLEVGYEYPLFSPISFSIRADEKVVITGFNGIGKSTLLKTILGEREKNSGKIHLANRAAISYFEQDLHFEKENHTALDLIQAEFPFLSSKQIRQVLARSGMKAEHITRSVKTLSGGEQSKIKLARLLLTKSNILILDEPTNHLDAASKEALKEALRSYEGCVILVSHEEKFYEGLTDREIKL